MHEQQFFWYFNSLFLGACAMRNEYVLVNTHCVRMNVCVFLDAQGCCVHDHVCSDCDSNHLIAINKDLISLISYLSHKTLRKHPNRHSLYGDILHKSYEIKYFQGYWANKLICFEPKWCDISCDTVIYDGITGHIPSNAPLDGHRHVHNLTCTDTNHPNNHAEQLSSLA